MSTYNENNTRIYEYNIERFFSKIRVYYNVCVRFERENNGIVI